MNPIVVGQAPVLSVPIATSLLDDVRFEREIKFLTDARPLAAKAAPMTLTRETTLDEAMALAIRNCLTQFLANWPAFKDGDAVEAIHQMRVSMRRLRVLLSLFARGLPDHGLQDMRQEARRVASIMGKARDWDVFVALVRTGPAAHYSAEQGIEAILRAAAERSSDGHQQVRGLLENPATSRFVLRLDAYVAHHGWRNGADLDILNQPVTAFAAQCLERLDKRVRNAGKHFDRLSVDEKHELRLRLKALRYAADIFGHLFKGQGKVRRYAERAAAMQDELGHLNDAVAVRNLVAEMAVAGDTQQVFAAGAIAGWYAGAAEAHNAVLKHSWARFLRARRYWRSELPGAGGALKAER